MKKLPIGIEHINSALDQVNLGNERVNGFVKPGFWILLFLIVAAWLIPEGFGAGIELFNTVVNEVMETGGEFGAWIKGWFVPDVQAAVIESPDVVNLPLLDQAVVPLPEVTDGTPLHSGIGD